MQADASQQPETLERQTSTKSVSSQQQQETEKEDAKPPTPIVTPQPSENSGVEEVIEDSSVNLLQSAIPNSASEGLIHRVQHETS